MPENYGDVSLNLPSNWSRAGSLTAPKFINSTVGHDGGISDLFITEKPEAKHQFYWAAKEDKDLIDMLRQKRYEFVSKDTWSKNPHIWEWDGEGRCWQGGMQAMARPAEFYYEEIHQRELAEADARRKGRGRTSKDDDSDEFAARAGAKRGFEVTDENGRPLIPMKKTG